MMGKLSDRLTKIEAAAGGLDEITHINVMAVAPTPDGPQYTGDVLVVTVGQPWSAGAWERRPGLAGTPASGKAERKSI